MLAKDDLQHPNYRLSNAKQKNGQQEES